MNRQDIPSACAQRTSTGPPSPREDGLPKAKLLWLQSHSIVAREAHLKSHLKVLSHLRLDVGDGMAANPANPGLLPLSEHPNLPSTLEQNAFWQLGVA